MLKLHRVMLASVLYSWHFDLIPVQRMAKTKNSVSIGKSAWNLLDLEIVMHVVHLGKTRIHTERFYSVVLL